MQPGVFICTFVAKNKTGCIPISSKSKRKGEAMSFVADLQRAKEVERMIRNELANHFRFVGMGDDTNYCDLWVWLDIPVLVEIKDERRFADSPNMILEMFHKQKPSCLLTTAASIQIHYFTDNRIVIFNIPRMRWLCSCWYATKKMPAGIDYIRFSHSDGGEGFRVDVGQFLENVGEGWLEVCRLDNLHESYIWQYRP